MSATSRQPLSSASEWPRSGNSSSSVTAGDLEYSLCVVRLTEAGTVWSLPPAVISRGPRVALAVSTLAGECEERLAEAASKSGLPGEGTAQRSYSSSDSDLGDGVAEPVAELLLGQRDRLLLVARVPQRDRGDAQRRGRQEDHALDRRGVDRDPGGGEILAQESLHDEPAEGVADHDRLRVEPSDDLRVVVDDVVDAVAGNALRVRPGVLDRVPVAGPTGRRRLVARLPEEVDPGTPGVGVQPEAVDEDDRGSCSGHELLLSRRAGSPECATLPLLMESGG